MTMYRSVYLKTIQRLCLFCFVENNGGRICFEGRSQTVNASAASRWLIESVRLTHHHRMELVDEWYKRWGRKNDHEDMSEQEV